MASDLKNKWPGLQLQYSSVHRSKSLVPGTHRNMYSVRADSRFAPSQWETALLCNDVSHWLGTNLESALSVGGSAITQASATLAQTAWVLFQYKDHLSRYGYYHYKDKIVMRLIVIMGIFILVRWSLYIEMGPRIPFPYKDRLFRYMDFMRSSYRHIGNPWTKTTSLYWDGK